MTTKQYIGARYVPIYIGVHDSAKTYEPLSIVSNANQTKTYTSKQKVPAGIDLENQEYWAQSGYFQDGIATLAATISELASSNAPIAKVTKTDDGATLSIEIPNSYDAGNSYNNGYALNTLFDCGIYIINCSKCAEVPEALSNYTHPVTLSIEKFTFKSGDKTYYIQQIVSDNGIYIRNDINGTWSAWASAVSVTTGDGLTTESGKIVANIGDGLQIADSKIAANVGNGLEISNGKIAVNLINAIKEGTWTADAKQSTAFSFSDCIYYRYPDNRIFVYFTTDDMELDGNSYTGTGVRNCTLPAARALNHAYSVKGAMNQVDTSTGNILNTCDVTITFNENGEFTYFSIANPTNTAYPSGTYGAVTFEYYGSPRL